MGIINTSILVLGVLVGAIIYYRRNNNNQNFKRLAENEGNYLPPNQ
jgi:hypothetical protein